MRMQEKGQDWRLPHQVRVAGPFLGSFPPGLRGFGTCRRARAPSGWAIPPLRRSRPSNARPRRADPSPPAAARGPRT